MRSASGMAPRCGCAEKVDSCGWCYAVRFCCCWAACMAIGYASRQLERAGLARHAVMDSPGAPPTLSIAVWRPAAATLAAICLPTAPRGWIPLPAARRLTAVQRESPRIEIHVHDQTLFPTMGFFWLLHLPTWPSPYFPERTVPLRPPTFLRNVLPTMRINALLPNWQSRMPKLREIPA